MNITVVNSFSFDMLADLNKRAVLEISRIDNPAAFIIQAELLKLYEIRWRISTVMHAKAFSMLLDRDVPATPGHVSLEKNNAILVGQYKGPEIKYEDKELPESSEFNWFLITVVT